MTDRVWLGNHHYEALVKDDANAWAGMTANGMPAPSCQDPACEIIFVHHPDSDFDFPPPTDAGQNSAP